MQRCAQGKGRRRGSTGLQFARFKANCAVQADFDALAEKERGTLRALLDDLQATLPDAPARRRSPPRKQCAVLFIACGAAGVQRTFDSEQTCQVLPQRAVL